MAGFDSFESVVFLWNLIFQKVQNIISDEKTVLEYQSKLCPGSFNKNENDMKNIISVIVFDSLTIMWHSIPFFLFLRFGLGLKIQVDAKLFLWLWFFLVGFCKSDFSKVQSVISDEKSNLHYLLKLQSCSFPKNENDTADIA